MKFKVNLFVVCLFFIILTFPFKIYASESTISGSKLESNDTIILEEEETVENDYFAGGSDIDLSGTVKGDAVLAGSTIDVSGKVEGDLLAAGSTLIVSGEIANDARLAGGQIHISGSFGKNLWIFGGQVTLSEDVQVDGSILIAGGMVNIKGKNLKEVRVYGGEVLYNGSTSGNVILEGDKITVGDKAIIGGDLDLTYETEKNVSSQINLKGQEKIQKMSDKYSTSKSIGEDNLFSLDNKSFTVFMIFFKFISILSILLTGLTLLLFFPKICMHVTAVMNNNPGKSILVGLFGFPLYLLLLLVLILTLIGIPLAFVLMAIGFVLTYLSQIFVGLWLGRKIISKQTTKTHVVTLFLGVISYEILCSLPFIGGIVSLMGTVLGMGAMMIAINESR